VLPFEKILQSCKKYGNKLLFKVFSKNTCHLPQPNLRFLWFWQLLGFVLIALVVWLSLTPKMPSLGTLFSYDKLGHFLAYATLMGWFAQLHPPRNHLRLFLSLIFLGIFLEYLQSFSAVRTPDILDAIANSMGVFIGWSLIQTPLRKSIYCLEYYSYKLIKSF